MTDDQERAQRDQDRSADARREVVHGAAEEAEGRRSETAGQSVKQQPEWEDEGGALGRAP